jgi:hypothetical protein
MTRVSLHFYPSAATVRVRELTRREELAVSSSSTADAVRLIAGAMERSSGDAEVDPLNLAAADR